MRTVTICRLAATLGAARAQARISDAGDRMRVDIGVNVGGVNDYEIKPFCVDAMKQSRQWGAPSTPWDEAACVDAQGWPAQDAGAVVPCLVADVNGNTELAGTYALSLQGLATVGFAASPGKVASMCCGLAEWSEPRVVKDFGAFLKTAHAAERRGC